MGGLGRRATRRLQGRRAGAVVLAAGLSLLGLGSTADAAPPLPATTHVRVEPATPQGPFPHSLNGLQIGGSTVDPAEIAPLRPGLMRFDARLDDLYVCADGSLDPDVLAYLNERADFIQAVGGIPYVVLYPMPPCLAAGGGLGLFGRDKRPPADPQRWRALVEATLDALISARAAAGKEPVLWYEAWNEPDWPVFYDGTISQFVERIFLPELAAVAAVEARSGVDVRFGGCGCLFADLTWIGRLEAAAARTGTPTDHISWHWYANLPFAGPDGMEPLVDAAYEPLWRILAHRNPFATASSYEVQARVVRARHPTKLLLVTEWNLSSAGFDRRNDTHEGAAFRLAALISMARGGVDLAASYRVSDSNTHDVHGRPFPELHGGWGLLTRDGNRKPAWYTHAWWAQMAGSRVAVSTAGAPPTLYTLAAADPARVTLIAANHTALGPWVHPFVSRRLDVRIDGLAPGSHLVRIHRVDATHDGTGAADEITVEAAEDGTARLLLDLAAQAAILVEVAR